MIKSLSHIFSFQRILMLYGTYICSTIKYTATCQKYGESCKKKKFSRNTKYTLTNKKYSERQKILAQFTIVVRSPIKYYINCECPLFNNFKYMTACKQNMSMKLIISITIDYFLNL